MHSHYKKKVIVLVDIFWILTPPKYNPSNSISGNGLRNAIPA